MTSEIDRDDGEDPTDYCVCMHQRHQHDERGGACGAWLCECEGFEEEES